jgi:DNA-binding XRE family transcriptional regulator
MELVIRRNRKNRNWTQDFVAENIGLTRTAVHDIETGKQKPSYTVLLRLCKLFEVDTTDIEYLFTST